MLKLDVNIVEFYFAGVEKHLPFPLIIVMILLKENPLTYLKATLSNRVLKVSFRKSCFRQRLNNDSYIKLFIISVVGTFFFYFLKVRNFSLLYFCFSISMRVFTMECGDLPLSDCTSLRNPRFYWLVFIRGEGTAINLEQNFKIYIFSGLKLCIFLYFLYLNTWRNINLKQNLTSTISKTRILK